MSRQVAITVDLPGVAHAYLIAADAEPVTRNQAGEKLAGVLSWVGPSAAAGEPIDGRVWLDGVLLRGRLLTQPEIDADLFYVAGEERPAAHIINGARVTLLVDLDDVLLERPA